MTLTSRPTLLISGLIWLAVTLGGIYFMKNVINPPKGEKGYINFGIDLVGGTYLTLDVKVEEAVKNDLMSAMQSFADTVKKENKAVPGAPVVQEGKGILAFETDAAASDALKLYHPQPEFPKIVQQGKNLVFSFSSAQTNEIEKEAVESNIATLRTRLDAFGAGEVGIVPQGERRIGIELPNVSDPEKAKARVGTAAILELKPVLDFAHTKEQLIERAGGKIPEGTMILPGRKEEAGFYLVPSFAKVTGKLLKNSRYSFVQESFGAKSPHTVAIEFKPEGATKFGELTRDNVGKEVAIILDNVVVSAPRVNEPIENGNAVISGHYTKEGAEDLVALLKSGAFSAPVEVIEERHIGPSLGQESIRKGLLACLIAMVLLFLFSITVYKVAGLFAFIVLIYNLLLILFGLAMIPDATLTLPGIAGMILTVGMAIDSSILIYERIKEELASGSSLKKAVDSGFSGALSVILDANITTFIVGAVLYYLGSPAIQGFALTMMIGIVATLITGLILLKTIFNWVIASGATSIKI
jgi:preprotein translocase subunit SecD